ncbi:MAG: DUF4230 domain-containing protein [Elusimicrobia bacterium]|nr:DUF4230 domain-containing protein [Elusimicrobiota bacterium]
MRATAIRLAWALAALSFLALGVRAASQRLSAALSSGLDRWRALTRAQLQERTREFVAGIPRVEDGAHLVVSVVDVHKTVAMESAKSLLGVDLGTTKVTVSVPARVHYAIDLSGRRPLAFHVDASRGRFVATFPPPQVQAVEVMFEGRQAVVETGWGRSRHHSGRAMEEAIDRRLRPALIRDAAAPEAMEAVRFRARWALARLLAGYLKRQEAWDAPGGFREIVVRFDGETSEEEGFWLNGSLVPAGTAAR